MAVELIHRVGNLSYMIVSEAGASVYSASPLAAEEMPDYDVNLRSAVSIARRLQDPLAELVKIDPKAIGVGQYQHDMPEKELDSALAGVVEDCVSAAPWDADGDGVNELVVRTRWPEKPYTVYDFVDGAFTETWPAAVPEEVREQLVQIWEQ